jgi:hypothetical protein
MMVKNSNYDNLLTTYTCRKGVTIDDGDDREEIPIHVDRTIMSQVQENEEGLVFLTKWTSTDYEQLCALDVLGLADSHENNQYEVYEEFKEKLE